MIDYLQDIISPEVGLKLVYYGGISVRNVLNFVFLSNLVFHDSLIEFFRSLYGEFIISILFSLIKIERMIIVVTFLIII